MTELKDYGIELKDITPTDNNDKKLNWIFPDSKELPFNEVDFLGSAEVQGKTGNKIPVYAFINGTVPLVVSMWNKSVFVPLPLEKGDKVKIYKNAKDQLELLKLN